MINIIIFACVCLTMVLFFVGFIAYQLLRVNQQLLIYKKQFDHFDPLLRSLLKKYTMMEEKLEAPTQAIKFETKRAEPMPPSGGFMTREVIENNYDRAKNLLKRGIPLDKDLMRSCQMTEEECELLADTRGSSVHET